MVGVGTLKKEGVLLLIEVSDPLIMVLLAVCVLVEMRLEDSLHNYPYTI